MLHLCQALFQQYIFIVGAVFFFCDNDYTAAGVLFVHDSRRHKGPAGKTERKRGGLADMRR